MDKSYCQTLSPSPLPSMAPKSTAEKPSAAAPNASKPALGGHDSGIKKGQAAAAVSRSTNTTKSIVKELTEARGVESEHMHRKCEMAHKLTLENAQNKCLKYKAKAEAARLEQAFKLEELKMHLEIAKLETQKVASVAAGPSTGRSSSPTMMLSNVSSGSQMYGVTYDDSSSVGRLSSPMMLPHVLSGSQFQHFIE